MHAPLRCVALLATAVYITLYMLRLAGACRVGGQNAVRQRLAKRDAASPLYFTVESMEDAYAELVERGVTFRRSPHQIADLGDRVLWLSDFEDGEGNVFALMAEIPKAELMANAAGRS